MAPKNKPAFALTEAHVTLLKEIDTATKSGNLRHVSQAEGGELEANGFIEINPAIKDGNGNVAARLTDKGIKEVSTVDQNTNTNSTAPVGAAPAVSFKIATNISLPTIARSGGGGAGRTPKYPVSDIPEGGAIFIPAAADKRDADSLKAMSKQFGSLVADKNKAYGAGNEHGNDERYFTSRSVANGGELGFGEEYNGVPGIGIFRRPVAERPVRKPRAAKTENVAS